MRLVAHLGGSLIWRGVLTRFNTARNGSTLMNAVSSHSAGRHLVILTDGYSEPITAKTACSVIRYCPQDVVAVFDRQMAGRTSGELLGVGGRIPVIGDLGNAPEANALMIGIAPSGGRIPDAWREIVLQAIARGMNIVSGMHNFLRDDPEFAAAAARHQVELIDVRRNQERDVATRTGIREDCLRIHTVGNDCSVGKMVTSIEITRGLQQRGQDAQFVATGQTGIMIAGAGCPVDCVVADFVNGAAEKLIKANQSHEILLIEGQGSLAHPKYSAVTLGLLHGCFAPRFGDVLRGGAAASAWDGWVQPGFTPPPARRLRSNGEFDAALSIDRGFDE